MQKQDFPWPRSWTLAGEAHERAGWPWTVSLYKGHALALTDAWWLLDVVGCTADPTHEDALWEVLLGKHRGPSRSGDTFLALVRKEGLVVSRHVWEVDGAGALQAVLCLDG